MKKQNDFAKKVVKKLYDENEIRVDVDARNEKIGAKIRQAELMKIPVMLIVGDKEMENKSVSIRRRHRIPKLYLFQW